MNTSHLMNSKIYLVISKSRTTRMTHVKMYVIKKRISYPWQVNGCILMHHRWILSFLAADADTTSHAVSGTFRISLFVYYLSWRYINFSISYYFILSHHICILFLPLISLLQSPFNSTFILPCFEYYMYINLNITKCIGFNAVYIKMSLYICT